MTVRFYSSVAPEKTLSGFINAAALTMTISDTIGLPLSYPYTLAVDFDNISEELVEVTNAAGTLLTITRAIDGTSATSHNTNARVRHASSARDFADSRAHENADDGIHGLAPGEEIVGTDKIQTLTNKTVVDLQGTLLNPDINLTGTTTTAITRTPAGAGSVNSVEMINGSDVTFILQNDGAVKMRNTPAMDALTTTRRLVVLMSNGTTERFYIDTTGMAVASPRAGTAATQGGFKVIDPGDAANRKLIQVRDSIDTNDKFVVRAHGGIEVTNQSTPAESVGTFQGAPGQSVNIIEVKDFTSADLFTVGSSGEVNANNRMDVLNTTPGSVVVQVKGAVAQTASLQTWETSAGADLARVRSNGEIDSQANVATTGIMLVVTGGWSVTNQTGIIKGGTVTINLNFQRTGGPIVAGADGNIADVQVGTLNAAYRPHTGFGSNSLVSAGTTGVGTGSLRLAADTGDLTLVTWSSNGTLAFGDILTVTMTYPLVFS